MRFEAKTTTDVLMILIVIVLLIILMPLVYIWAWNTLFGSALFIPTNFWTWLATLFIAGLIGGRYKTKSSNE